MLRHEVTYPVLAALCALAGCKKHDADATPAAAPALEPGGASAKPPAGGCGPLRVTVGGAAVTGLHGFAVTLKNGAYETEQVELYDNPAVGCAEVLAPNPTLPEGLTALRVYYHREAQGLGTEAYTEMGVTGIALVAKADAVGGSTTICVPAGSAFTPNSGFLAGKRVEVSGALTGNYCGVKDLSH